MSDASHTMADGEPSARASVWLGPLSADVSMVPGTKTASLSASAREHLERALAVWAAVPRRTVEVPSLEAVVTELMYNPYGVLAGPDADPVSAFLAWCRQPVDAERLVTVVLPDGIANYWAAAYRLVLPGDWAKSESKRRARHGALVAGTAVAAVVVSCVVLLWQALVMQRRAEIETMGTAAILRYDIKKEDDAFSNDLQLSVEGTGSDAHIVVSFSNVFDLHMQKALDVYARMPAVGEVPTLDDVRTALTADPRMVIWGQEQRNRISDDEPDNPYESVYRFVSWCIDDATLVHREAGTPPSLHVSNYGYVLHRDDPDSLFYNFCFPWETESSS